jgi:hypothetical protein
VHTPSPPEEEVEVWERPREDPSRLRQTWRRLRPFWLGVVVLVAGLALLAFENLGSSGNYWQQHPLATNLATEAVMALALVFGLERFLEARSHRRWRRCGLTIAEDLDRSAGVDETIDSHVLSYCQRVYGEPEIPAEASYFKVLLRALRDPATWAGGEPGGAPPLMEWLRSEKVEFEERFSRWAPLLFSDPSLAPLAAAVPPLLHLTESIVRCFEELQPEYFGDGVNDDLLFTFAAIPLATQLRNYSEMRRDLISEISRYRTGRPLRIFRQPLGPED